MGDSEREEEQSGGNGQATTTAPGGGTVEEAPLPRKEGEQSLSLSLVTELCDGNWKMKEVSAECLAGKVVDHVDISLGQAQVTMSKSAQTLLFTPTQFIINEDVLQVKREVHHVAISLGQTHKFIITPPIFTNSAGVLQLEGGLNKQEDQLFNISSLFSKSLDWPIIVEEEGRSPHIVSSFIEMEALRREATILYDPGGRFLSSCITWSSCFKLWDPGGRLIIVCYSISSP